MFRDAKEELRRLEEELLAQDEPTAEEDGLLEEETLDALLQEDTRAKDGTVIYKNFSNAYGKGLRNYASGYRAYNTDHTDENPDEMSEALLSETSDGLRGLTVTALVLSCGIVLTLIWLLLRYWGIL